MKVLLVDDHPMNMALLKSAVADRLGCPTLAAPSGRDALTLLERHRDIGLIITDLHMPEVNGIALLEQVRSNPRLARIPVIVCTMDSSIDTVVTVASLGIKHLLRKPIKVGQLHAKMREALVSGPVKPPSRLQILLALGIELSTYEQLLEQASATLSEILREKKDENDSSEAEQEESEPGLNAAEMRRVARLMWPEICSRIAV